MAKSFPQAPNKYQQSQKPVLAPGEQPPVDLAEVAAQEEASRLDYLQIQYDRNKKVINGVVIGALLLVAAFFGWRYYNSGQEEKAASKMFYAEQYFAQDSTQKALQGEGTKRPGFLRIAKDFGGTKSGNLAKYYAGICYLKQGDAKNAIKYLEDFDGKGTLVGRMADGRLGDAYMESNNPKKAIEHYQSATEDKADQTLTPLFLLNLGLAYEQNKQPEEATKIYKRIRDEYPQSVQMRDVERYLAMLGVVE